MAGNLDKSTGAVLTAPTVEMVAAMIKQQWLIEEVMQRVE